MKYGSISQFRSSYTIKLWPLRVQQCDVTKLKNAVLLSWVEAHDNDTYQSHLWRITGIIEMVNQ